MLMAASFAGVNFSSARHFRGAREIRRYGLGSMMVATHSPAKEMGGNDIPTPDGADSDAIGAGSQG